MDVNTDHTRTRPVAVGPVDQLGASMTRGWPYQRKAIKAFDANGMPILIYVGLAHDAEGKPKMALAIGDVRDAERSGPTALLDSVEGAELIGALGVTYADFIKRGGS